MEEALGRKEVLKEEVRRLRRTSQHEGEWRRRYDEAMVVLARREAALAVEERRVAERDGRIVGLRGRLSEAERRVAGLINVVREGDEMIRDLRRRMRLGGRFG